MGHHLNKIHGCHSNKNINNNSREIPWDSFELLKSVSVIQKHYWYYPGCVYTCSISNVDVIILKLAAMLLKHWLLVEHNHVHDPSVEYMTGELSHPKKCQDEGVYHPQISWCDTPYPLIRFQFSFGNICHWNHTCIWRVNMSGGTRGGQVILACSFTRKGFYINFV